MIPEGNHVQPRHSRCGDLGLCFCSRQEFPLSSRAICTGHSAPLAAGPLVSIESRMRQELLGSPAPNRYLRRARSRSHVISGALSPVPERSRTRMAIGWQAATRSSPGSTRIPRSAHEAITASRAGSAFGQADFESAALRHKDRTG